jgi:hypothetical protein
VYKKLFKNPARSKYFNCTKGLLTVTAYRSFYCFLFLPVATIATIVAYLLVPVHLLGPFSRDFIKRPLNRPEAVKGYRILLH